MKFHRQKDQKVAKSWSKRKTGILGAIFLVVALVVVVFMIFSVSNMNKKSEAQSLYQQAADAWKNRDLSLLQKTTQSMESSGLCENNVNCTLPKLLYATDSNDRINSPELLKLYKQQTKDGQKLNAAYKNIMLTSDYFDSKINETKNLENDNIVPMSTLEEPPSIGAKQ